MPIRSKGMRIFGGISWGTPARALHYARLLSRRGLRDWTKASCRFRTNSAEEPKNRRREKSYSERDIRAGGVELRLAAEARPPAQGSWSFHSPSEPQERIARGCMDFVTGTGGEEKNHSQESARGVEPRPAAVTMLHEETGQRVEIMSGHARRVVDSSESHKPSALRQPVSPDNSGKRVRKGMRAIEGVDCG
ncbi:hypothetical protein B0H11DRAFT_1922272 [Mycena galericulata]|nr:hypothetical protein B0H11DRAFT_1922272 [Mycena galericulata]